MRDVHQADQGNMDEIDLRELFVTVWRHKWFIFWFTFILTLITIVVVYRMPKYYKTTTVIEVKPKSEDKSRGINIGSALGDAGVLLGLTGIGGGESSTTKDAIKMTMFRINQDVMETVDYSSQFYTTKKFRSEELGEDNCSISINDLRIPDYRKYGMKVIFELVSDSKFRLIATSKIPFMDEELGTFNYDTPIHTRYFDCTIHKEGSGTIPETIVLNGDKHYIFNEIISKNLTAEVGSGNKMTKANLPFVAISFFDTLPQRGEHYVNELLKKYIKQSVGDDLEDIDIQLGTINKQIKEIKTLSKSSGKQYEKFKSKNAILSPKEQAKVLIEQRALTQGKLSEIYHKLGMVKKLIQDAKNKKNIDTMAPALVQLGDKVTASFIGKLQDLQIQEATLSQEFTDAYPKLKAVRRQISNLRTKIRSSLVGLQKILKDEINLLKKEKSKYTQRLKQGPKIETDLASLTRDYKLFETMHTYLLQKKSSLDLKKAEALSRFRIIDPIYTNPRPAKPKKALIAIVGLITAFLLAIFIVFFREFLREDTKSI